MPINDYRVTMKSLVVLFLLALAASASAGVYKTLEEIEDRFNNGIKEEDDLTLVGVKEMLQENEDRITDGHNENALPSDGVYETSEESKDPITNGNKAGVYETREDNKNPIINPPAGVNDTYEKIEGRITNGYDAYSGQLPYQAFLSIQSYTRSSWCGASLIGSEWVLTAAHCIIDAYSVTVYLGSIQRYYGTSRTVSRQNIIIHHSYNRKYPDNDIALIKIPAVSLNSYIQPVKLPAMSSYPKSYAGEHVIASGWGQTTETNYLGSDFLQWARLQVITNSECTRAFGYTITSIKVCTTTPGGSSICFGDSGGPIVTENGNVQIGLSAFLYSTQCTSGYPAGFTRLTSYLDWIKYYTGIYYT